MAAQVRATAFLRSANFLTGVTPARLLKISTRRLAGHAAASSANALSLVKTSVPSVFWAAFAEAKTVMLFSASMVNALYVLLPGGCAARS